jgi:hypothetical protein
MAVAGTAQLRGRLCGVVLPFESCDAHQLVGAQCRLAVMQRNEPVASTRFYEDSFVKPLLIAAFMGGTSWAPHEGR